MKQFKAIFPIIIIAGLLIWSACKKDDNKDVVAGFSYELTTNPGEVIFTNQSANADVYEWNFGDGTNKVTFVSPTHTFEENNTYIVILKATGSAGNNSVQDTVIVNNIP